MRVYRSLSAAAIALIFFAKLAVAQSSVSLTHVVSVTVPARVRVKVSQVQQPAVSLSGAATAASALSLSINASRAWMVSIERGSSRSKLQGSKGASRFEPLGDAAVPLIARENSTQVTTANLVVRADGVDASSESTVRLTITAP